MSRLRPQLRRASAYLLIVFVTAIVLGIGLSALLVVRLQGWSSQNVQDFAQARLNAQAAIERALHIIASEPGWRTGRGSGVWFNQTALPRGTFSLQVGDPLDGDLANNVNDPVLLTATGQVGRARYRLQVRLETDPGPACLENSLHAAGKLTVDNAQLYSDQIISANGPLEGKNGSSIYAHAQSAQQIAGSTFYGLTTSRAAQRPVSDPDSIIASYTGAATNIAYASLPAAGTNLLVNGGFETGVSPWVAFGPVTLTVVTDDFASGTASLKATDRSAYWAGPSQSILGKISNGKSYVFQAMVRLTSGNDQARLMLHLRDGSGDRYLPVLVSSTLGTSWVLLSGHITVTWSGSLTVAEIYISTANTTQDFYVDDVRFMESTTVTHRSLSGVLLGPAHNPFSSETNAYGLYRIDCGGQKIIIENCRIIGTLILENPGSGSEIRGSICWEPAISNYPILLSNQPLTIGLSLLPLHETAVGINFNPTGAAYPYNSAGLTDTDRRDTYPSTLRGLIFSKGNLTLTGQTTIDGLVLSAGDITVKDGTVRLRYRNIYWWNPPPGFSSMPRPLRIVPGSWGQVVD